jgi:hypothetical protein
MFDVRSSGYVRLAVIAALVAALVAGFLVEVGPGVPMTSPVAPEPIRLPAADPAIARGP